METAAPLEAGMPEPVVDGALLLVVQDRVRLGRLLELALCGCVPLIAVRVMLEGGLLICPAKLVIAGIPRDAQHLVVVTLIHVGFGLTQSRAKLSRPPGLSTRPRRSLRKAAFQLLYGPAQRFEIGLQSGILRCQRLEAGR